MPVRKILTQKGHGRSTALKLCGEKNPGQEIPPWGQFTLLDSWSSFNVNLLQPTCGVISLAGRRAPLHGWRTR